MTHDLLADVLAVTGVRGVLGARIDAGSDWAWHASRAEGAALHAVTHGHAWFTVDGGAPFELIMESPDAEGRLALPSQSEHRPGEGGRRAA